MSRGRGSGRMKALEAGGGRHECCSERIGRIGGGPRSRWRGMGGLL